MYLVEADTAEVDQVAPERLASKSWENFPPSCLSHHGASCCEVAREWVLAMDFAQLNGADLTSGPRWLRARYKWGPSAWPMHWCDVVGRKVIDCGAHAALSREAFEARGLVAFPTQLVQRYSEDATDQWQGRWSEEKLSCHWLEGEHIYHEATAILVGDNAVKVWDGSAGSWIAARSASRGYGSAVAIRIYADPQFVTPGGFLWDDHRVVANVWNQLTS